MIRRTMMAFATLALGACGGSKAPAPDTSAGTAPVAAGPTVDSATADTARPPVTDTSVKPAAPGAKPGAARAADTTVAPGDRDIAIKPKYTIDEKTGKVTPIKRP